MLAPAKPRLCPSTRSRAHRGAQRHPAAMPGASVAALPCSLSAQSQTPQGNFGRSRRFPAERTADGEVLIRNPATSSAGKKKKGKKGSFGEPSRAAQQLCAVARTHVSRPGYAQPDPSTPPRPWLLLVPPCLPVLTLWLLPGHPALRPGQGRHPAARLALTPLPPAWLQPGCECSLGRREACRQQNPSELTLTRRVLPHSSPHTPQRHCCRKGCRLRFFFCCFSSLENRPLSHDSLEHYMLLYSNITAFKTFKGLQLARSLVCLALLLMLYD